MEPGVDRSEALFALQKGVWTVLPEGDKTVSAFGRRLLGLDAEAFAQEVKTMMLNGKVVDHPDECVPKEGDVLIFSGAMPGLVGAMLRSDSPIKAMRATITQGGSDAAGTAIPPCPYPGHLKIKAFNTILRDHLNDILEYGVSTEEEAG